MARCLLALGSNLGDRQANLSNACSEIASLAGCHVLARSHWYCTAPIGGEAGQGEFLNGALLLDATIPAAALLAELQQIENQLGRKRAARWDARTIDIDMLLYGTQVTDAAGLVLPHPRMSFRQFVLEPASEIAGGMLHPTSGWTLAGLRAHLQDSSRFVVVTSDDEQLAECLVSQLSAELMCPVWQEACGGLTKVGGIPSTRGVEFPESGRSDPPVLAAISPTSLRILAKAVLQDANLIRPALVIAVIASENERDDTRMNWPEIFALGPLASITTRDPKIIAQEAEAAVRCAWPDLS